MKQPAHDRNTLLIPEIFLAAAVDLNARQASDIIHTHLGWTKELDSI